MWRPAPRYAPTIGAGIITNSWGYSIGTPTQAAVVNAINNAATKGRDGLGCTVLFVMNNGNRDGLLTGPGDSSLP